MPLAIELAAARVNVFSVKALAAKLDDRLGILSGGERTADPRLQTMRATIDWSYGLLSGPEQRVFERLSIFAGGCTLDSATNVCAMRGRRRGRRTRLTGVTGRQVASRGGPRRTRAPISAPRIIPPICARTARRSGRRSARRSPSRSCLPRPCRIAGRGCRSTSRKYVWWGSAPARSTIYAQHLSGP